MLEELRYRHHWILGQTRTGKTTVLELGALEDMDNGHGVFYLDPHGSDQLLQYIPKHRHKDVIVFDLSDTDFPIAWNPLQSGDAHSASVFTETLKAIWGYADIATPQLDQTLYNTTVAIQDIPSGTLLTAYYFLTDTGFRERSLHYITDPVVADFWHDFGELPKKDQRELVRSTLNKIQMLVADPRIRNVVAQPSSKLDFTDILDNRRILIVRLPIKDFGTQKVSTVGSLLLSQLYLHLGTNKYPFHVHIDDVQYFQTPVLTSLLSLAGRYQMSITVVSQYLAQLAPNIVDALIGNVGRKTGFKMGVTDSRFLADDFSIAPNDFHLHELPPYRGYVSTPTGSQYHTFQLPDRDPVDTDEKVIRRSRRSYASQRQFTEKKIARYIEVLHEG